MKHFIEMRHDLTLNQGGATTLMLGIGSQFAANVRCYVIENNGKYIEVADIELAGGTVCGVPCEYFMFIDRMD